MACFIVPAAEAVVTAAVGKIAKKKEKNTQEESGKISFSRKIGWLTKLLSGGSALLAFEHLWHGEISPFFPFLTAMSTKEDTLVMLKEMGTVGVSMAVICTLAWAGMLAVSHIAETNAAGAAGKAIVRRIK